MQNMINAVNAERRQFLVKLLSIGHPERDGIVSSEINNVSDEIMLKAYEAAIYGNASNLKIIYLLGGNNPINCPFK